MILLGCLVVIASICAIKAVRAVHLLHSALWLAGDSMIVAIMLYLVGAYPLAVIELSISVGLITILLVFAIGMVGADSPDAPVSKWINWPLLIAMVLLVIGLTIPVVLPQAGSVEPSFSVTFWQGREADVMAQVALIFAGVLGVLGLLREISAAAEKQRSRQQSKSQQMALFEDESRMEKV